jgi:hypothetical protein
MPKNIELSKIIISKEIADKKGNVSPIEFNGSYMKSQKN